MNISPLKALLLSLCLSQAFGAESISPCDPILAPIANEYADFWIAKLDRSIRITSHYLPSGLSREQLNIILGVPAESASLQHLEALSKMNHWEELAENPSKSFVMHRKAIDFVSQFSPINLDGKILSEVRFSLLRDLFNRISQLSNWQAYDYAIEDGEGRHHIFVGRNVVNVLVIRAQTGEIFSGIRAALKNHRIPDKTFFRAPLRARRE